jgi:hypothetical protein
MGQKYITLVSKMLTDVECSHFNNILLKYIYWRCQYLPPPIATIPEKLGTC